MNWDLASKGRRRLSVLSHLGVSRRIVFVRTHLADWTGSLWKSVRVPSSQFVHDSDQDAHRIAHLGIKVYIKRPIFPSVTHYENRWLKAEAFSYR